MTRRDRARTIRATIDEISPGADDLQLASLIMDDGSTITVPAGALPQDVRIGDVLIVRFEFDASETESRRGKVAELQRRLFGQGSEP